MLKQETVIQILWRYKQKEKLTNRDRRRLRAWLMKSEKNQELFDDLSNPDKWDKELEAFGATDTRTAWLKLRERMEEVHPAVRSIQFKWINFAAAASILLLISGFGYWYIFKNYRSSSERNQMNITTQKIILPGRNTASLKLSDGSVIDLDTIARGLLSGQAGITITKNDSETISYGVPSASVYSAEENTLNVPAGGQFHIQLPDGSQVWLNASSSLKYPTVFTGASRKVSLSGEAYFEVAKDKIKPFLVESEKGFVRVLGTHFNLKAYTDEQVTTVTLLEGSVAMGRTNDSLLIHPGEFASIDEKGLIRKGQANIDQALAWRKNAFWFHNATYEEIMQQLKRWYDIEIVFKSHSNQRFSGILPRDRPLGDLLNIMEKEGHVHFELEGRKLLISPS
jgi:transmembrane sensor